tara:strand:- start:70 stop:543 length:474 start_codon:yes stop_codon:yes gene_type:complete
VNDTLKNFKNWYLEKNIIKPPLLNGLMFIDGIAGITLYRSKPFQVQMFICNPDTKIKEHSHPNVDSYELFLWGMTFTHKGKTIINQDMAFKEKNNYPRCSYWTLRVKPNDLHGGFASNKGGAFISIQEWLHGHEPKNVSEDWQGDLLGPQHKLQLGG